LATPGRARPASVMLHRQARPHSRLPSGPLNSNVIGTQVETAAHRNSHSAHISHSALRFRVEAPLSPIACPCSRVRVADTAMLAKITGTRKSDCGRSFFALVAVDSSGQFFLSSQLSFLVRRRLPDGPTTSRGLRCMWPNTFHWSGPFHRCRAAPGRWSATIAGQSRPAVPCRPGSIQSLGDPANRMSVAISEASQPANGDSPSVDSERLVAARWPENVAVAGPKWIQA
jgi:hypothetical protein